MKKTILLYTPKLNQSVGTYLAFANVSNDGIATANQKPLDYAAFFVSSADAEKAVDAYLYHPSCKMAKSNRKFITIEPYEFEIGAHYDGRFPFTSAVHLTDSSKLKNDHNTMFRPILLEYGTYVGIAFVCADAYKSLT